MHPKRVAHALIVPDAAKAVTEMLLTVLLSSTAPLLATMITQFGLRGICHNLSRSFLACQCFSSLMHTHQIRLWWLRKHD